MSLDENREYTPRVVQEIIRYFRMGMHVVASQNTDDRLVFGSLRNIQALDFVYAIASILAKMKWRIAVYSPSQGIKELCPAEGASKPIPNANGVADQAGMMNIITRLLRDPNDKWLVVVLHPEALAPRSHDGGPTQGHHMAEFFHWAGKDPAITNGPSRLLLVCYAGLPAELITNCPGYAVVEVPLPDAKQRELFIEKIISVAKNLTGNGVRRPKEATNELVAKWTSGMTLIGIERLLLNAAHEEIEVCPKLVSQAKTRDIRRLSQGTLEVCDPEYGFERIGGLTSLKLFFEKLIVKFMHADRDVPQSILFAGVSGAGKTLVAMAIAHALGWSFTKFGEVRNSYLGESERRLNLALKIVEQMGQTVLFIDEFDQNGGQDSQGPDGTSGTDSRMEAAWLEWSSKPSLRGRVLIVAATNRPERLKPSIIDRFDYVIPFVRPGIKDIVAISIKILDELGRKFAEIKQMSIGEVLEPLNPTGRNLKSILAIACQIADEEEGKKGQPIRLKHLKRATLNFIPRDSDPRMKITELEGLDRCDYKFLLPGNGLDGPVPGSDVPRHLQMYFTKDGGLDKVELAKDLAQLKASCHARRVMG